jgi:hypothetical protein
MFFRSAQTAERSPEPTQSVPNKNDLRVWGDPPPGHTGGGSMQYCIMGVPRYPLVDTPGYPAGSPIAAALLSTGLAQTGPERFDIPQAEGT